MTGGTNGIGRCVADYLASAGANIAIVAVDDTQKTIERITADYSIKTLGITCDVTGEAAVERMVETVSREIGTADVLFNNAGINIMGGWSLLTTTGNGSWT